MVDTAKKITDTVKHERLLRRSSYAQDKMEEKRVQELPFPPE